jgi:uncharacterized protein (DUF983 family)
VRGRLRAILKGTCPRCRAGSVFAGVLRMNERCPSCGLVFEREPGYFTGAMVLAYGLGVPLLAVLTLGAWLWLGVPLLWAILIADVVFLVFVPLIFRWSRVLWIHLDRTLDPER